MPRSPMNPLRRYWPAIAAVALAAVVGCADTSQPDSGRDRIICDRDTAEDAYAETLSQLRRFEQLNLDVNIAATKSQIDSLAAQLASADQTLDSLERQRKQLIGQMELAPTAPASSSTQPDWAEQVSAVRLMRRRAEQERAGIDGQLVRAREAMAELRQLAAQRDILANKALALEKRLLELNRKLGS